MILPPIGQILILFFLKVRYIYGTPNTFPDDRKTVTYVKIEQGEYDRLTKQLKSNETLEERVKELEKTVRELKELLIEEI